MANLTTLEHVLGGKNGAAQPPDPYSPTVQAFSQREESVLGRLTRQGVDTLGLNWSRLNSLLATPDLYEIQQTKNKALWKTGRILWDQVALDDMVDSATTAWISAIVQDVRMIPADDTVEAKWVSDAVTYSLETLKGGLLDRLYAMFSGAGQGFSVNMYDLGIMTEGPWHNWLGIADIRYMLPHFLVPKFDDGPGGSGALQCVYQTDPNSRGAPEELSLDRMMHWRHRPAEDPFSGRSLWVPAHPHWRAKQLLLELRNYNAEWNVGRLEVQHLEQQTHALPETEFIRRSEAIIAGYLRFRGYKMWRGMAAKLVQSVHGPEVFDAVIRDCNMAITRSIGPPWLTMEEGQFGTRAQSEVHASTFEAKIRPERQRGEEVVREGPVRAMCDANGWAPRFRPRVTLARAPESDQQQSITLYYQGIDKGVIHPAATDENEVLGRIGWPLRKEQAADGTEQAQVAAVPVATLNGAQIQSATEIINAAGAGTLPAETALAMLIGFLQIPADVAERIIAPLRKKEGVAAPAPEGPATVPPAGFEAGKGGQPPATFAAKSAWWRRPLTKAEQRYKMAGGGRDLGDIMSAMAKAADAEWEEACRALQHKVSGWILSERISPKEGLKRLETLTMDLDGFQGVLVGGWTKCYGYGQSQAAKELEIAGAQNLVVPKLSEGAMRFDAKVAPDDPLRLGNFIDLMKSESFKVKKGYEDKAYSAITALLNTAYNTGERPEETVAKLDTIMLGLASGHLIEPGKPGHDYTEPAVQETIVRTMANNSFSAARMDLYERNDSFVLGTERSEVAEGHDIGADGKDRSHPLSEHLDQLRVRLDDPRRRKLTGARHWNERGVDIPLTELDEPIEWSSDSELDQAIAWGEKLSVRFF